MNVIDDPCYPLISVLAVFTAIFLRTVVKQRVPLMLGFASALQFVTSLLVTFLMGLHTLAVVAHRITQKKAAWVQNEPHVLFYGVPYDFRLYSLVLIGVVMTVLSVQGIIAAYGMVHTNKQRAFSEAMRSNALLLGIALPIMPLQGFAVMVVIPALAAIAVLEVVRRTMTAPTRKGQMVSLAATAE
jgi:hypothetical protein